MDISLNPCVREGGGKGGLAAPPPPPIRGMAHCCFGLGFILSLLTSCVLRGERLDPVFDIYAIWLKAVVRHTPTHPPTSRHELSGAHRNWNGNKITDQAQKERNIEIWKYE